MTPYDAYMMFLLVVFICVALWCSPLGPKDPPNDAVPA